MVTIVKHEWHSVDSQFAYELDEEKLSEIYSDLDEDEISELLVQIEMGYKDVTEVINDAWENDVEIEWDRQYDDWYSDRKGGYDITYELGDENSWVEPPKEPDPTHKCTKCKWKGQSYDAEWQWEDSEGNEYDEAKHVCPMCDSDLELTEHGKTKEKEQQETLEKVKKLLEEKSDES